MRLERLLHKVKRKFIHTIMNGSFQMKITGLIFLFLLTQFNIHFTSADLENAAVQGDLQVLLKPASTLLHRRSTRASTNAGNAGGRWMPVQQPKSRKPSSEGRYFDQRAMTLHPHPPFPHNNNIPRPMPFQGPNPLRLTRPSQPEQPVPPNAYPPPPLYRPPPPIPPNQPTPPSYLAPVPLPPNQTTGEVLMNNPSESELRFLFHRPEDENLIKSTILEESQRYNERVSFVRGPTLKFQRRQTIYLPPRKKSVIYILLKEPQVQTDLEVIESQSDPTPEVNIVYEKAGGVRSKHYYSTSDKLLQNGATSSSTSSGGYPSPPPPRHHYHQDSVPSGSEVKNLRLPLVNLESSAIAPPSTPQPLDSRKRSIQNQVTNPCQPNLSKKLRKR